MIRRRIRALTALAAVALLVAACSSSIAPSASPSVPPSTGPASPSVAPSVVPPSVTPSAAPSVAPPSATPSPTPAPTLSPAEADLAEQLRVDARVGCVPRRSDLPPNAVAGVECHPKDPLVNAVGIYGFGAIEPEPALAAYLDRLEAAGVSLRSGDCAAGTPGDRAWPTNLPDEGESGSGPRETRAGCFLDEFGTANIRLTCYGGVYVGVLGNTKELALLNAWTWKVAEGESVDRDPPGICARPD